MSLKIILSSSGLKNLVSDNYQSDDEFCFIFGDRKLPMKKIFAEFISPAVSRLHQADPTISFLSTTDLFQSPEKANSQFSKNIFNEKTISYLKQISAGYSIEITEDQIFNMQIISILLGNEELFYKINDIYSNNADVESIDNYLQQLQFFYYCSRPFNHHFNYANAIEYLSGHFYSIDKEKLKQLPRSILLSIISSPQLRIENEDSLLDFVQEIFDEKDKDDEDIGINEFYEQIDFLSLSEEKFHEFLEKFEINEITQTIWTKLCRCFYINYLASLCEKDEERYSKNETFESPYKNSEKPPETSEKGDDKNEFNFNGSNHFNGIIHHFLNEGENGLLEKVEVTSSSKFIGSPSNVILLDDKLKYFMSDDRPNNWIKYDFGQFKVRPSHYSIRTWDNGKRGGHLKNWCIEGSNTDSDDDWKLLDSRNDVTVLDNNNAESTFHIQENLDENECFRYIRLRQTGSNMSGNNYLILNALEFFGSIIPNHL